MLDTGQLDVLRSPVTLEFRILGPLEVSDETGHVALGGPRQRGLLAILVLDAGRVVATDRLIDLLWGEEAPKTATASLQNTVARLRRVLGADVLVTHAPGYVLKVEPDQIDARRFERALADRGGFRQRSDVSDYRPPSTSGGVPRSPSSRSTTSRSRRPGGSRSCGSSSSANGSTPISSSGVRAT